MGDGINYPRGDTGCGCVDPRRPDLRQLRFEVQRTFIENRALADELQDFTNDCYSLALYMWKQRDQGQTKDKKLLFRYWCG